MHLDEEDFAGLVRLARDAMENHVLHNNTISADEHVKEKYSHKCGVFVTLNSIKKDSEELRGCIGFPMPDKMLYDAIIDAAISSATGDPRFKPVTKDELDKIAIEISVLTTPELINVTDPREYGKKIEVGKHGLIIRWQYGSGLLLPQVPIEYGWDEERFLCETCVKAGAMPDCWFVEGTRVYKFEALVFKELEPRGSVVKVPLVKKLP